MTTLRTSIAVIGALMMLVAPAATAADKPDDEHLYFATDGPEAVDRHTPTTSPRQYGLPRAMPWHYEQAGIELHREYGLPRATTADYARAGFTPDGLRVPVAASSPGFDWSDAGLGAAAAASLILAMIASSLPFLRRRRETRTGPSVVQH